MNATIALEIARAAPASWSRGDPTRALDAFREWTDAMAAATPPVTRIVAREAAAVTEKVFDETGWQHAVVKPTTGAGGHSVELPTRGGVGEAVLCRTLDFRQLEGHASGCLAE